MRGTWNVLLTSLATAAIALLLAWLPQTNGDYRADGGAPAFQQNEGVPLTDRNLVDRLAALPLQLRIGHVDWQSSVLSVDLLVSPATMAQDIVYHDLYELARFGVQETPNVNQVTVRVMKQAANRPSGSSLLAALDARKEFDGQKPEKPDGGIVNVEQYLQTHYRMTYTQEWKRQFAS